MFPEVLAAAGADPAEPASGLWVPIAGAAAAIFAAVWSVVRRWNFSVRIEAVEGKLRFSATVAKRSRRC